MQKERKRNSRAGPEGLFHGDVPNTAAECGNEYHFRIDRVWHYPVAPFEVESRDALPGLAAIRRTPRRRFEPTGIKRPRGARIGGHVVNVLILIEHTPPVLAAIRREVNAAATSPFVAAPAPRGEIEPLRIPHVDSQ